MSDLQQENDLLKEEIRNLKLVQNIASDLPSPPTFSKSNPNDEPIKYIALYSNSVTRARIRSSSQPSSFGTSPIFSATVTCGNRPPSWIT